jgi:hypothetical protein
MSEIGTQVMPSVNLKSAYSHSFGLLGDNTKYVDVYSNVDMRGEFKSLLDKGMEVQQKALVTTAGGAGTAGYALIPVYVDQRIVDQTRKFTPWVELVPRVTNMGITADYNVITAKGAAVTKLEDAPLTDVTDTEDRASTAIKYLYSVGRVTGPMQAAMPSYIVQGMMPSGVGTYDASFGSPATNTAKNYEVLKRSRALRELEENLIWNGDASTTATEYSGIVTLQSTTNKVDLNSTALKWSDLETAVQYAFDDSGRPTVAGCDSATMSDIRSIMIDTFRMSPSDMTSDVGFGIKARVTIETMVGPVPVIPSQYLSTTSGSKSIYFLDMENIEMRVLQDMSYEDLAKTNDSQKFMLKIYEAFIMKATQFNSFVGEIL